MSADRPSGFTAVMAQRAPTDPDELDHFPTPPWAARAGGELIARLDPGDWIAWEPACGQGHMAHALADYFPAGVIATDIHEYARGTWRTPFVVDFLSEEAADIGPVDWIITNPPFQDAEAFIRTGLKRARRGVAMLVRLVFLEGQKRHDLLHGAQPVTVVAPFAERVPMVKGRWDPAASSATAYAWFIWQHGVPPGPRLEPIGPGTKKRLTRASDQAFAGEIKAAPASAAELEIPSFLRRLVE